MKIRGKYSVSSLLLVAATFFVTASVSAQDGPHMPLKEMVDACQSKADGDACSFMTPKNDTLNGHCHKSPNAEATLACMPKPPKEAVDACQSKADGDACSFMGMNNVALDGNCKMSLSGDKSLVCAPKMQNMDDHKAHDDMPKSESNDSE